MSCHSLSENNGMSDANCDRILSYLARELHTFESNLHIIIM